MFLLFLQHRFLRRVKYGSPFVSLMFHEGLFITIICFFSGKLAWEWKRNQFENVFPCISYSEEDACPANSLFSCF